MMKAGTLVKTNKARIGVPLGSVGLVVKVYAFQQIAVVRQLSSGSERRWLLCDLEVAND